MTKDMTKGSPVRLILTFSIPLLIGNIFQQFYSMVDTIIVGRFVGVQALAAVGSTGSVSFLVIGFIMGITGGFSVLVAQRFGANDEEGVKKAVASATILSLIATVIITIVSVALVKPLLSAMNTPSDIIADATKYITIVFSGTCAVLAYNMISGILRALGDSKTPLYFLIVASVLNIILDLVFIINFNMGVAGAAYATVISQGLAALLCFIYSVKRFKILRLEKRHFKLEKSYIKTHLNIGIPMALQFSLTAIGTIILQGALNVFGSTVIAAFTAASKVEQLIIQPAVTFGITMATYSGQNLGAGRIDRIKDGVKKCSMISIIFAIVGAIGVMTLGDNFVSLFISDKDPEVISYAMQYLNTAALFFIPLVLIFIYRNTLQGIGKGFIPMMAGVFELVARATVAFTLPGVIGYTGICLASPAAWLSASIPLGVTYFITIKKMLPKREENIYN